MGHFPWFSMAMLNNQRVYPKQFHWLSSAGARLLGCSCPSTEGSRSGSICLAEAGSDVTTTSPLTMLKETNWNHPFIQEYYNPANPSYTMLYNAIQCYIYDYVCICIHIMYMYIYTVQYCAYIHWYILLDSTDDLYLVLLVIQRAVPSPRPPTSWRKMDHRPLELESLGHPRIWRNVRCKLLDISKKVLDISNDKFMIFGYRICLGM